MMLIGLYGALWLTVLIVMGMVTTVASLEIRDFNRNHPIMFWVHAVGWSCIGVLLAEMFQDFRSFLFIYVPWVIFWMALCGWLALPGPHAIIKERKL